MSTSTLDLLFSAWKGVHGLLLAGALGLLPSIAVPALLAVYRHHEDQALRALAAAGLAWSVVVLVVAVPAFAVRTHPTYDFGLSALLFMAISLAAAILGLVCAGALWWKVGVAWPVFVALATVPLVLGSMKLKREAHEWEDGGRDLHARREAMGIPKSRSR